MNHISKVCQQEKKSPIYHVNAEGNDDASMAALVAHISFDDKGKLFENFEKDIVEIQTEVKPFAPIPETRSPKNIPTHYKASTLKVFPDSGASIWYLATKLLVQ